MNHLKDNQAKLPSGILTPARFQQLGILFGMHGEPQLIRINPSIEEI